MNDAIVDEIHRVREEYARQFNFDLAAIVADLRRLQVAEGAKVVSFPKRPPVAVLAKNLPAHSSH